MLALLSACTAVLAANSLRECIAKRVEDAELSMQNRSEGIVIAENPFESKHSSCQVFCSFTLLVGALPVGAGTARSV